MRSILNGVSGKLNFKKHFNLIFTTMIKIRSEKRSFFYDNYQFVRIVLVHDHFLN